MNKNKKLSDITVKEFEELINNIISKAKLYCPQTQQYWYFPNYVDNTCFFGCEGLYFEQTLAEVINNLWQDLTDQEKEEIGEY